MKLLMLAPQPFFQQRGTPLATLRVLRALAKVGHDIDLLTYHEGEAVDLQRCRHFRTPALPGLDGITPGFSFRKLVCDALMLGSAIRLCRRNRYDAIHAVEESVFIAMGLRTLFGTPYLYDMDSSLPEQLGDRFPILRHLGRLLRRFEERAVRRSAGVVAVCRALEDVVRSYEKHPPVVCIEDASLISTPSVVSSRLSEPWPGAGSRRSVMYVGNLQPYQGIDLLLESFARLLRRRRDTDLVIVGGGDAEIEAYRQRARELGVAESTQFLGPRPVERLGEFLAAADLVVSPRISGRNTPMKIFSYLDSGTPILATKLATHTQVLDAETAILTAPVPGAMAAGMDRLLSDPTLGARIAAAARERAATRFDGAALDRKLVAFYRKVFKGIDATPARESDPRTKAPARSSTRRSGFRKPAGPLTPRAPGPQ